MKKLYVLQYSATREEWLVELLSVVLKVNKFHYMKGWQGTFVPLAVSESVDELEKIKETFISEKSIPLNTVH